MKFKNIALLELTGLVALVVGCSKMEAPKKEDFTNSGLVGPVVVQGVGNDLILWDFDDDRQVDAIGRIGVTYLNYVDEGYKDKVKRRTYPGYTQIMSAEMKDSASKALQAIQNLGYEAAKQRFNQTQK